MADADQPPRDDGTNEADGADAPGRRTANRRRFLRGATGLAGTALTAGCAGTSSLTSWMRRLAAGPAATSAAEGETRVALDPDDLTAEPMHTQVRSVDGTNVLFQYGRPVPSFETWSGNSHTRNHRSLNGTWRFRFDPADVGVREGWHAPDVDASDWRTVQVPLPWDLYDTPAFGSYDGQHYGRGTAFYDGYAWYRTEFAADDEWTDRTVRLGFLGAGYMAWVFVDGTLVGQHEGGNTPFSLDVTDHVTPGEDHTLAVRVHRRPWWASYTDANPDPVVHESAVPAGSVDYWPYAGLTRDVYLTAVPRVSVSKLLVDARDGVLSARVVVVNDAEEPKRRRVTLDPGDDTGGVPRSETVEIAAESVRVVPFEVSIPSASAWSPSSPALHTATATLAEVGEDADRGVDDELSTRYGMRAVEAADGDLTIDGEAVFLKGVNWHEETPERGRSLAASDYDDVLARLDDLDANLLRNSHYNRHPYLYEAADEAGLFVLDEAENVWLDGAEQRTQLESYGLSRALVASMAWNQHNHPSVCLFSLQNECSAFSSAYAPWLADMREAVRALDVQRRPITWASKTPFDPEFEKADVVGLNEYYGYFQGTDGDLGRILDVIHDVYPETPILVTENGTWSAPELRGAPANSATMPGTPEWQAAKFEDHWRQVVDPERPYVTGYAFWNLKDYKERHDYNRFNYNGISTMGLLSFDGERETLAYEAFRDAAPPDA